MPIAHIYRLYDRLGTKNDQRIRKPFVCVINILTCDKLQLCHVLLGNTRIRI